MKKEKSDGGSSGYYVIPDHVLTIGELVDYRNMTKELGEIFERCYSFGDLSETNQFESLVEMDRLIDIEIEKEACRKNGESDE